MRSEGSVFVSFFIVPAGAGEVKPLAHDAGHVSESFYSALRLLKSSSISSFQFSSIGAQARIRPTVRLTVS